MKQHYVPKCYLEGFADRKNLAFRISKKAILNGLRAKPRQQHISSMCYDKNIYTINKQSASNTFQIHELDELFVEQNVLGRKETKYSQVRDRIIKGNFISSDDLIFMCDFIVQLKLRNPFWKNTVIEKQKDIWVNSTLDRLGEEVDSKEEFQDIPKGLRKLILTRYKLEHLGDPEWSSKMQQFSLIERDNPTNSGNQEIRKYLLEAVWAICEVPLNSHTYLITTDNPGFAMTDKGDINNFHVKNDFTFFLPLTYRYCLQITSRLSQEVPSLQDPNKLRRFLLQEKVITSINKGSCLQINDSIIGFREKELDYIKGALKKDCL